MNIRKKKLEITGWPVYPIAVGETALISEDTGMRRTSTVLRMKKVLPRPSRHGIIGALSKVSHEPYIPIFQEA